MRSSASSASGTRSAADDLFVRLRADAERCSSTRRARRNRPCAANDEQSSRRAIFRQPVCATKGLRRRVQIRPTVATARCHRGVNAPTDSPFEAPARYRWLRFNFHQFCHRPVTSSGLDTAPRRDTSMSGSSLPAISEALYTGRGAETTRHQRGPRRRPVPDETSDSVSRLATRRRRSRRP